MKIVNLIFVTLFLTQSGCQTERNVETAESTKQQLSPQIVAYPAKDDDPIDANWQKSIFKDSKKLTNVPEIELIPTDEGMTRVTASNIGTTVLQYYSAGPKRVQLFQEIDSNGEWNRSGHDWCGTGKELFEIEPGESVELIVRFWDVDARERMLANFSEKGTEKNGLVVLAMEKPN